jgi:hypothetical protein
MISGLLLPSAVRLEQRIPACEDPGASGPGTAHVQRAVGLPVTSWVETVPHDLAGGGLDGSDPAEAGKGGLAPEPLGVVASHNQEGGGVVGADARQGDQLRGRAKTLRPTEELLVTLWGRWHARLAQASLPRWSIATATWKSGGACPRPGSSRPQCCPASRRRSFSRQEAPFAVASSFHPMSRRGRTIL